MATWNRWSSTSASTTTSATGDGTYSYWSSTANDITSGTTSGTWHDWSSADPYYVQTYTPYTPEIGTQFKSDFLSRHYRNMQHEINREWYRMQADWLQEEKEIAEDNAKALLLDLVSQKEFEMYEKTGKLLVNGRKMDYIIHKKGSVITLTKKSTFRHERKAQGLCVSLNNTDKHKCPETDNVIAMKMNIEHEEERFIKTANRFGVRGLSKDETDFLKAINE